MNKTTVPVLKELEKNRTGLGINCKNERVVNDFLRHIQVQVQRTSEARFSCMWCSPCYEEPCGWWRSKQDRWLPPRSSVCQMLGHCTAHICSLRPISLPGLVSSFLHTSLYLQSQSFISNSSFLMSLNLKSHLHLYCQWLILHSLNYSLEFFNNLLPGLSAVKSTSLIKNCYGQLCCSPSKSTCWSSNPCPVLRMWLYLEIKSLKR